MMLLSAEALCKSYGDRMLLNGGTLHIEEGQKIGVVGVNGAGKSTLLRMLAGAEEPDAGTVTRMPGVRIGYLPQNPTFPQGARVLEQVLSCLPAEQREARAYEAKNVLTRLGLTDYQAQVQHLSGGKRRCVALAGALFTPCELLILDEPTNHIDSDTVEWLEAWLHAYKGALCMVTHDRYFLDRVTDQIVEVEEGKLYRYAGNYGVFLQQKAAREEVQAGEQRKRQSLLKREIAWMQRGARARGTKSKGRIERIEALKAQPAPQEQESLQLQSTASRLGKKIVTLSHVYRRMDNAVLIDDFSASIARDARIGIVGKNGCGKSTLLKLIAGTLMPDAGEIERGDTVRLGVFSQESEELDPSRTVLESVRDIAERIQTPQGTVTAAQLLETFLFPPHVQYKRVAQLSGGERRRLLLLRVLMGAPNVLLLDEPTNDLDIETLTILEAYLQQFAGAVLAVSHDRYFLDKVADHLWVFEGDGRITPVLGGYTDAMQLRKREQKDRQQDRPKHRAQTSVSPVRKRKPSYNEQREYACIDEKIAALEAQLKAVEQRMERCASDYAALQQAMEERQHLQTQLDEALERWVILTELFES